MTKKKPDWLKKKIATKTPTKGTGKPFSSFKFTKKGSKKK